MEDQEKIKELFSIISALEVEIQAIQAFSAELAAEDPATSKELLFLSEDAAVKNGALLKLLQEQVGQL